MNITPILSVVFMAAWWALVGSELEYVAQFALMNGAVQALLFLLVACIPVWRTGRMSYVDIAWPFGVALIGVQAILLSEGDWLRSVLVGSIYLFIGLRMGIGAIVMGRATGVIFKTEFPRYQYRRMLLEQSGAKRIGLHMQVEVIAQGLANISVLALPAMIITANQSAELSWLELAGFSLWAVAYLIETIADSQKLWFISKHPKDVCNIGLWRYSRHPNYFAEWLVWTGLVIASIPSWYLLQGVVTPSVWLVMGLGLISASCAMYVTLVYLTGAKPAEYYSVQKRPGYAEYQSKTNILFPWFPK